DNRLHVVTEAADLDEARDVLEAVLCNDRVDVPATARRRALGRTVEPREDQRRADQTPSSMPGWVEDWRLELERARSETESTVEQWRTARTLAADELAALQPALARARSAWAPFVRQLG